MKSALKTLSFCMMTSIQDVSLLRSKLLFHCPSLQGSLVVKDLEQLQWSTKQKVLSVIFQNVALLSEQLTEMNVLIDERNSKLSFMKTNLVDKEKRIELEREFRTNFLRVALSGLERLRWPQATEAFSDPLKDLMNDNSVFLQAVEFLITVGFSETFEQPKSPIPNHEKSVSKRKSMPKEESFVSDTKPANMVIDFPSSAVRNSTAHSVKEDGNSSVFGELHEPCSSTFSVNDFSLNAFERLCYQNQVMHAQLKTIQDIINVKENAELTVASLLQDLRLVLQDLANVNDAKTKTGTDGTVEMTTCKQCGQPLRKELSSDLNAPKEKRNWSKFLMRVTSIEEQWNLAQKQLKQSFIEAKVLSQKSKNFQPTRESRSTSSRLGSLLEKRLHGIDTEFHSPINSMDTLNKMQVTREESSFSSTVDNRETIQSLQRELIGFYKASVKLKEKEVMQDVAISELQRNALQLSNHLATISPSLFNIVFNTNTDIPVRNTGLEELIRMIRSVDQSASGPNKQMQNQSNSGGNSHRVFQQLCDRAMAESRSIARSYLLLQCQYQLLLKILQQQRDVHHS